MPTSARHWGCRSAFQASREPIPHFTNVRTPLFWQRPSRGWQPIRNAPTRLLTSPTAILSGGRICGPGSPASSGWNWLRHDTSTLRGRWPTKVRYGTPLSKRTDCRNTASRRLRRGATRMASSLPITISSLIPARPAASDSTIWWTPRKCFSGCFRIFSVTESFRNTASVLVVHQSYLIPCDGGDYGNGGSPGLGRLAFCRSFPQHSPLSKENVHECIRHPDYRRLDRYRPSHGLGLCARRRPDCCLRPSRRGGPCLDPGAP